MNQPFKPFNAAEVEPNSGSFDLIPKGKYKMAITKSDYKAVKSGKGFGLNLEIDILDGQYKGRKLFEWLNIEHQNEEAQQIGQGKLSAICRAVNILDLRDPSQLHDLPFIGAVAIKTDRKSGDERNVINSFEALSGKVAKVPVNKDIAGKFDDVAGVPTSEEDVPW